jgi:hypothetical protein
METIKNIKEWFVHNPLFYTKRKAPLYTRGDLDDDFNFTPNPNGDIYRFKSFNIFYRGVGYDPTWLLINIVNVKTRFENFLIRVYFNILCKFTKGDKLYIKRGDWKQSYFTNIINPLSLPSKWIEAGVEYKINVFGFYKTFM